MIGYPMLANSKRLGEKKGTAQYLIGLADLVFLIFDSTALLVQKGSDGKRIAPAVGWHWYEEPNRLQTIIFAAPHSPHSDMGSGHPECERC